MDKHFAAALSRLAVNYHILSVAKNHIHLISSYAVETSLGSGRDGRVREGA
jgi:hypothetical protein